MSFDRHQPLPVGKLPSGLLGQLLSALGPSDPDVLVGAGLGRDAAAIAFGDRILVAKTDPITFATTNAAAYLVDVNANDLACLGATPRWLLVTALLPEGITAGEVIDLFAALDRASKLRGISLVGGHTEITAGLDRTILVGFLLGETARNRLLPPGGARPGDRLLLTKALAIEGTALLAAELRDLLVPRLGDDLVKRAAALVTEGGVAVAVREITAAGNLGAVIEATSVPVLPETKAIAAELGLDPLGMLGSGSLLATANPSAVPNLIAAAADAGVQMTEIGQITWEAASVILQRGNDRVPMPQFDTDEVSRALIQFQGGRNEDE
jgi:hydrogenase maturation factor